MKKYEAYTILSQVSAQMILRGLFEGSSSVNVAKAHVEVRDMKECAMTFYDGFPALAVKFFKRVREIFPMHLASFEALSPFVDLEYAYHEHIAEFTPIFECIWFVDLQNASNKQ